MALVDLAAYVEARIEEAAKKIMRSSDVSQRTTVEGSNDYNLVSPKPILRKC